MNKLFYGDNLQVLRDSVASESVDLIYLDPPFNSKRDYNLLFKNPKAPAGESEAACSTSHPSAFEDTWHWTQDVTKAEGDEVIRGPNSDVSEMMKALVIFRPQRHDSLSGDDGQPARGFARFSNTRFVLAHDDAIASHYEIHQRDRF